MGPTVGATVDHATGSPTPPPAGLASDALAARVRLVPLAPRLSAPHLRTRVASLLGALAVCASALAAIPVSDRPVGKPPETGTILYRIQAAPSDPGTSQQWALRRLDAAGARDLADATGTVVAVVDSGVDASHPDLAGVVLAGADFVDSPGASTGNGWRDDNGHGTHVAGIIAARQDGVGVEGLAPGVRILPVRVLDASGVGDHRQIAAGIRYAADAGAAVINLSLGGPEPTSEVASAVEHARARGAVVVAAAGNDGPGSAPLYPAAYPGVVAVGATTVVDSAAMFSATGPHLDVAAPGMGIYSTIPGGGHAWLSGTSQAAPFVAAAAAMARASGLSASETTAALAASALDAGAPGPDDTFGAGVLDVVAALGGPATVPTRGPLPLAPPDRDCCTMPSVIVPELPTELPGLPDPADPTAPTLPAPRRPSEPERSDGLPADRRDAPGPLLRVDPPGELTAGRQGTVRIVVAPAAGAGPLVVTARTASGAPVASRQVQAPARTELSVPAGFTGTIVLARPGGAPIAEVDLAVPSASFVAYHPSPKGTHLVVLTDARSDALVLEVLDAGRWTPVGPLELTGPAPHLIPLPPGVPAELARVVAP